MIEVEKNVSCEDSCLQIVIEKILSKQSSVRQDALELFAEKVFIRDDAEELLLPIVDKLFYCNKETQKDVLQELPSLLEFNVARHLIRFLTSNYHEVRAIATLLLHDAILQIEDVESIVDLLDHGDPDTKSRAVELLVASGQEEFILDRYQ